MATKTSFGDMLKEVLKEKNSSRTKKFVKMKSMGMATAEARKLLDQMGIYESAMQNEPDDIYYDTAKAPKGATPASPTTVKPLKITKSTKKIKV